MIRRIAAGLPGFVTIDGQTVFSVRYGTRFGMTPEEVAALELEHGYEFVHYDPESPDVRLYDSGKNLELCYEAGGVWMGPLKLYRFEYDFTRPGERLFRFCYVFVKQQQAFFPLALALGMKHGAFDNDSGYTTSQFAAMNHDGLLGHHGWALPDGEGKMIVIDLWMNEFKTCFLVYERQDRNP